MRTCAFRTSSPEKHLRTRFGSMARSAVPPMRVIHLLAFAGRSGREGHAGGLGWSGPQRSHSRGPDALGQIPHGRFLLRRWRSGSDPLVGRAWSHPQECDHSKWQNDLGKLPRCAQLEPGSDSSFRQAAGGDGGVAVLRGNLAPDGAVLKPSAASPHLMKHRGRAVVFENIEHYNERIEDPNLDVDENCILVLKNCGPKGYPGMPEVGNMSLPAKFLRKRYHRYGAHLRCAHERNGLRHSRAPRLPGSGRRRNTGARARWRHDRTRCRSGACISTFPKGNWSAVARNGASPSCR